MELELYKADEYPVVTGNQEASAALCVLWQDPIRVASAAAPHYALIGSLRSPFGVNVILYNLALNPQITQLVVWGPDQLSNTDIGRLGKSTLFDLWQHGVDEQGATSGGYRVLPEIELGALREIIRNVELVDLSTSAELPLPPPLAAGCARRQVRFPAFVVTSPRVWPSEEVAIAVRERTGAEAYLRLLECIWRYGAETPIDHDGEEVKELRGPVVTVEAEDYSEIKVPDWLCQISELGINREALENYARSQFSPEPYLYELFPGVSAFRRAAPGTYLYAEQLFAFPRPLELEATAQWLLRQHGLAATAEWLRAVSCRSGDWAENKASQVLTASLGDEEKLAALLQIYLPPTDQIANVIERLRRKPEDLDKECLTWDPRYHSFLEGGRPCLIKLSYVMRAGKLDCLAFFRSHDIFGAWFHNYYGIATLLRRVALAGGVQPGRICIQSESAHIYPRHWSSVEVLLEEQLNQQAPRQYFVAEEDADPRGNVQIALVEGEISVKLISPDGETVVTELKGRNSRELHHRLRHARLLSRLDHAMLIGAELEKAELALRLGIPYRQDRALDFSRLRESGGGIES